MKYLYASAFFLMMGCSSVPQKNVSASSKDSAKPNVQASKIETVKKVQAGELKFLTPTDILGVSCPLKADAVSVKKAFSAASACVKANKWPMVEELAKKMSEEDWQSYWGAYFYSLVYENKNQLTTALWQIELAIRKNSNSAILLYQKGRLLWKLQEYGDAVITLQKSLDLDSSLTDTHLFLGQVFFRDQEYSKAMQQFQLVLQARPQDPIALMGMSECMLHLKDTQGALEYIQKLYTIYPNEPFFWWKEASLIETTVGDKKLALEKYQNFRQRFIQNLQDLNEKFKIDEKIQELATPSRFITRVQ